MFETIPLPEKNLKAVIILGKTPLHCVENLKHYWKTKEKRTKAFSEWAKLYVTNEYPICYMLYDNLLYGTNKWYTDLKLIECNSSFLILI